MGKLKRIVENIPPAKLSKLRGKRQNLSTRDKALFLKKIEEIESFIEQIGFEIILKEVEK